MAELLFAPKMLKNSLIDKIRREARMQRIKGGGLIQFKINALEDADIIQELYRASQIGVKIDLIIRDTCCLRPGISNISHNIRVISNDQRNAWDMKVDGEHRQRSPENSCLLGSQTQLVEIVKSVGRGNEKKPNHGKPLGVL